MSSNLIRQLSALGHGTHSCFIYENEREQMDAVAPFIKAGLERNERCSYIASEHTVEEAASLLTSAGIDVQSERARHALDFSTGREAYLPSGHFDPDERLNQLGEYVRQAIASGFSGLRSIGEMGWIACAAPGCERAPEYEARLNDLIPQLPVTGMCQYKREQTSPSILRDVLRAHPIVVLKGKARRNLYYEPSEMFLGRASDAERVAWMIDGLNRAPEVTPGSPVLVVDEDQDIRLSMERKLESLGYTVVKAENAPGALEIAAREHPYFILTNTDLPWLGNLIDRLREEPGLRDAPVVSIYPDRPEEFHEDRILVLDDYRQLEELWPSKAASRLSINP
jgi:CheY-like chemotaxis protein